MKHTVPTSAKRTAVLMPAVFILLALNTAFFFLWKTHPVVERTLDPRGIRHENSYAFVSEIRRPNFFYGFQSDDLVNHSQSGLELFEDGRPLGPAHSYHDAIRASGKGAFSHWRGTLYFSSSDNTDPRTNGRSYRFRSRASLRGGFLLPLFILDVLGLAFLAAAGSRSGSFSRFVKEFAVAVRTALPPHILIGTALSGLALFFLYRNEVPVTAPAGRLFYAVCGAALFLAILCLFFLAHRYREPGLSIPVRILRKIALISLAGVLFLLSVEAFARAVPRRDTLAVNPGCRFFWPDWYQYPLNQYGYRERPIGEKTEGVYRIVIYGDSYVEGAGVARSDLTGARLETLLNRRLREAGSPLTVQAYNLGHCGANTKNEVDWILRDTPLLEPDLVILGYVLNDAELEPPALLDTRSAFVRWISGVLTGDHGSYLYYRILQSARLFFPRTAPRARTYMETIYDEDYEGWRAGQKALEKFHEYLEGRGVSHMALIWPLLSASVPDDELKVIEKAGARMRSDGIEAHSLLEVFDRDPSSGLLKWGIGPDDPHPNAMAHAKVAEYLAKVLWNHPDFRRAAGLR